MIYNVVLISGTPWIDLLIFRFFSCVDHYRVLSRHTTICKIGASQVALVVKNPPANAGDLRGRVRSLGQEDPLEEQMATHCSSYLEDPHGQRSLAASARRVVESDTTE